MTLSRRSTIDLDRSSRPGRERKIGIGGADDDVMAREVFDHLRRLTDLTYLSREDAVRKSIDCERRLGRQA